MEAQKKQVENPWSGLFVEKALQVATETANENAIRILGMTASTFRRNAPDFKNLEVAALIEKMQKNPEKFKDKMTVKFGEQIV